MYKFNSENKTQWPSEILTDFSEFSNISEVIEEEVNFIWKISKWSSICPAQTSIFQPCRSPCVKTTSSGLYPSEWFFELRNSSGFLSLILCKYARDKNKCIDKIAQDRNCYLQPIKCHFKIVDHEGRTLQGADGAPSCFYKEEIPALDRVQQMENDQIFKSIGPDMSEHSHWLNFIHLLDLFENRDRYLRNDAITFEMNFKIPCFHVCSEGKSLRQLFYKKCQDALDKLRETSQESLVEDISKMFLCAENSDFTIHSEGFSCPVHKHIILGRCRKLYNVLTNRVTNKYAQLREHTDPFLTNSALLCDVEPEVLKALIEFIYKGSFSTAKALNDLKLLLKEGSHYGLHCLKDSCFVEILGHVSVENVASIILLAETYAADENIKSYLHKFCQEHHEELGKDENFLNYFRENPTAFYFLDVQT